MAIPNSYKHWRTKLNRFASKEPTEAEHPSTPMLEANIQMIGNYSSVPETFYIKPPQTLLYCISRALILVRDNTPMDSDKYISAGPLTNGIHVRVGGGGLPEGNVTQIPIKRINDFASLVGVDVTPMDFVNNPTAYAIRWTFDRGGDPVWLNGDQGDYININLNDNFSSLTHHTALYQGVIFNTDLYN